MGISNRGNAQLILDAEHRAAALVIEGDCDIVAVEQAEPLLRQAVEADVERLELNLCRVRFADSAAVRLSIAAERELSAKGGQLIIKAPPPVKQIFDLTQTADRFEIVDCSGQPHSSSTA